MTATHPDHLVVTAPNLEDGIRYVQQRLGAKGQPGGVHAAMGTHNYLFALEGGIYLEVIAPNPAAPAPSRPRWFGLDFLPADSPPRLATWVARTDDLLGTMADASFPFGAVEPMRRGDFNWSIAIPEDGALLFDGAAPMLIQWLSEQHPASRLQPEGCVFKSLEIFHPEAPEIEKLMQTIGLSGAVSIHQTNSGDRARLVAHIKTPNGVFYLE